MAIVIISIAVYSLSMVLNVVAHERDEHDEDINYVLFGDKYYKDAHPRVAARISAIEDAAYLCIDQFNGHGENALNNLISEGIPDLPTSISEIDYTSNYTHRNDTHRGWNMIYPKRVNWPKRQQILRNTIKKEIFEKGSTPLSRITEKVLGNSNNEKKCESFCIMLYCIHIIGDHIEAGRESNSQPKELKVKLTGIAYINPLTRPNDRDNPGIIPDLIVACETLFKSQKHKRTYKELIQDLEDLQYTSDSLVSSKGGIDTEEEFDKYNECAKSLLDTLALYIPKLLKKEPYFRELFY